MPWTTVSDAVNKHKAAASHGANEKRDHEGRTREMKNGLGASRLAGFAAAIGLAAGFAPAFAFKDVGPKSSACDAHEKGSPAWTQCAGAASEARADAELFYAGYWLARTGRYEEALQYLARAKVQDERVLTYIGFATRKLGRTDEALGYYRKALEIDPGYSVARAYMGEGFLAKDERAKAAEQLDEIARRSGRASAEYGDLAGHIAAYDAAHARRG
jgi:tetratricopeptide (TPR) repeat protein